MPQPGAIRAGRAFVELFADDSKLVRGLRRASARLKAFGEGVRNIGLKMAALGAAVIAPLAGAAKSFADMGSKLWDMSKRTGVSVEALSALGYTAEQSGADVESLEVGLRKMQKTIVDAASGSASAQEALALLGLAVQDLVGLSPEQQFKLIADRIDQIADPTLKAAAAMEVFGKSGTGLLPMFEGGAAALDAYEKQARRLGLVMSTEDAKAADEFGDALTDLWKVLKQAVFTIGSALAPLLQGLAQRITAAVVVTSQWLRQNKELVVTVLKVAAAVLVGGLALVTLGYAITGLAKVLAILATVITGVGTILKLLGAVLAWMISPIGLVITAVVALGAYILYATGMGAKALGWLGDRFGELRQDATDAYQGIADALAAGDIGLAAKILWLTLKMEWTKGVNWISSIWNGALLWLRQRATEAFYGLVMGLEYIWHGLEVAWIETTAFLSSVWTNFCAGIHHAWMWVVKSLEETWNKIKGLFDSSFDADAANAAVEKQYQQARDQMWSEAKRQLGEREAERARQREQARQVHEGTLNELVRQGEGEKQRLQNEYDRKMQSNQDELDAARKEWRDALEQAKKKRQAKEAQGPEKMEGPDDLLAKVRGGVAGLGDLLDQTAKKTLGVAGTFNAAALQGLQAGGMEDRIANATERTAKGVEGLRQDVKNNKPAFV
ncbi:MAG: hypothetical protein ACE15C_21505 [Phycisphaerae bacterium]